MIDGLLKSGLGRVGARPDDPRWGLLIEGDWGERRRAYADVLEDGEGVGFVVQLDPADETVTEMLVRVMGPERSAVAGVAPFATREGHFATVAPVQGSQGAFFVPWAALVDAPTEVHVVVAFAAGTELAGHTAFDLEVRPPAADLTLAAYVRPVALMALAVADADGVVDDTERASIRVQLQTLFDASEAQHAEIEQVLTERIPSLRRLAVSVWCRFPELDVEELFYALIGVANAGGEVTRAELEVVADIARHLEVEERRWRRWAYKLGVDLPAAAPEGFVPPRRSVAKTEGRRLLPSVILRLDPHGQDRRNPLATLAMLCGLGAMVLLLVGFWAAVTPVAAWATVVLLPTQWLLAVVAAVTGWMAWKKGAELDGAGQGAALSGMSLAGVFFVIYVVLAAALCLGVGANALLESVYGI